MCKITVKHTRLCYWIAQPAKPGMQSSNNSWVLCTVILHPRAFSLLPHTFCIHRIEMALVWWVWYTFNYIFLKFTICSIALINLDETCHLKRCDMVTVWQTLLFLRCYYYDSTQQHYEVMQLEYVLWCHTMHEWVMNNHYQSWIAQGQFTNIILTPSKQLGVCKTLVKNSTEHSPRQ